MADVKCPMCSKPNQPDVEVCEFCGARITPVTAPLDPIKPGDTPTLKKTSDLEKTLPSWLRDARKAAQGDDEPSTEESAPALSELEPTFSPEPDSQAQEESEPAMPADLLAGLTSGLDDDDEDDVPDWLTSLRADQPEEQSSPEAPAEGGLGDLLASLEPQESSQPEAEASDPLGFGEQKFDFSDDAQDDSDFNFGELESPDWLSALKGQQDDAPSEAAGLEKDPQTSSAVDNSDLPSWLDDLAGSDSAGSPSPLPGSPSIQPESTSAADSADTPDWLASLSADDSPDTPTPETEAPALAADDSDTPDWLASLSADETPEILTPETEAPAADTPDWLASLSAGTPDTLTPETEAPAADTPDWLASLSDDTPDTLTPETEALAADTPDWLASLSDETPDTLTPETETPAADTPDWLASLSADETPDTLTPSDETFAMEGDAEEIDVVQPSKAFKTGSLGEIRLEETPDWLAGALPSSQSQPPAVPEESPESPEPAEEQSSLAFEGEENLDSIFSADVPDWLAGFTPGEVEPQADKKGLDAEDFSDEEIAPASLPSWVQAMRPVESVVSEDDAFAGEEQVNPEDGPLAGYLAVLPTQTDFFVGRKSPARAIKLQADEVQQSQAALLEALVRAEGTAQPVRTRRKVTSDRFLRWLVTIVLLLAVFAPSLLGTNLLSVPQGGSRELISFIETLRGLDEQVPALVVVDYQPAMAGEMETVFTPVLNDLMIFGKPVAFVSTSPTGPVMVSRMVEKMRSDPFRHTYRLGEQFVDLGYLPGDAVGIRSFAVSPREALSLSGIGVSFWDLPVLSDVQALSDFSALIVVTDNPDTGRIWVEQAGPLLQDKPLLMVISAQAEPMLIPYYDSGQVRGLLTGLSGGLNYEAEREYSGQAHTYWDAYGFGLMAIQSLILIGGLWSLATGIYARRKEREEAEE
ncbi:MAG: hypothetical protein R6W69_04625 [Anaerolineales bacterium]